MTSTLTAGPAAAPAAAVPAAGSLMLSDIDRRTLRKALAVVKAMRAEAAGPDQARAAWAKDRLTELLCYLSGYLDATYSAVAPNPGFQSIVQSSPVPAGATDDALDDLEKSIQAAVHADETRGPILGGIILGIGVALKALSDSMD